MDTVKVYQLGTNSYQVTTPGGRTYLGDINFIVDTVLYMEMPGVSYEVIPIAGIPGAVYKNCFHDYVEMGFTHSRKVCKLCDVELGK